MKSDHLKFYNHYEQAINRAEMMIRGSIGKLFCIKPYNWGIIKTKFPDMTRIVASPGQRKCRDLFREVVAYAKTVIIDKEKKKEWNKRLKRKRTMYNAAVKAFMLKEKLDKERREMLTRQAIRKAFKNHPAVDLASSDADMACVRLEEDEGSWGFHCDAWM